MGKIKHGHISVTIPDELDPPDKAGKMTPEEVSRIPKAPRGLGLACEKAADAIKKAGKKFAPPPGVTPEGIVTAGNRAEDIDLVINDMEVVLQTAKQANLLFDADAYEQLRKVNDQVKVQGKHDPELLMIFKDVIDYFARGPRGPKAPPTGGGGSG
jgi:hypothetical protein